MIEESFSCGRQSNVRRLGIVIEESFLWGLQSNGFAMAIADSFSRGVKLHNDRTLVFPAFGVPAGSPSRGGNVAVYVFDINQPSLPTLLILFLCLFLSLWPFEPYFIP